jgi:hypothetical protein
MIRTLLGFTLVAGLLAFTNASSAQELPMPASANSSAAFHQLKSLAGTWEGYKGHDVPVTVTYSIVSNGSAVMERLQSAREPEMITMYTLEGDHLLVTHYCSMGNQPTLQTDPLSSANGQYDFHFVRVSGTKTPDEGHMANLVLSMPHKDHLKQVWTFEDHGKSNVETFLYTRKM